jgi:hypothetical protein
MGDTSERSGRDQGDKEKDHIETTPEFQHETKHQRKTSGGSER